jgi:phytoene dehydrogenase-like protein
MARSRAVRVGGDQLSGSHHPFQHFFFRALPGWTRHRTPIEGLYLCGAATWPGVGFGAGSGYLFRSSSPDAQTRRAGDSAAQCPS